MEAQRSSEAPGCSEIDIEVISNMQSTNKAYHNHLESKI